MPRPDLATAASREPNPLVTAAIRACPDCAGPIVRASGCLSCRQCGWGRCG
jgi:hypothetical protein